jgi:hypothetical protein
LIEAYKNLAGQLSVIPESGGGTVLYLIDGIGAIGVRLPTWRWGSVNIAMRFPGSPNMFIRSMSLWQNASEVQVMGRRRAKEGNKIIYETCF